MKATDMYEIIKSHQKEIPVDVEAIADELGIKVVYKKPAYDHNISGMIQKKDNNFEITVNAEHAPNRQRFTIAHEIAHFVLHQSEIGDGIIDDALYRSELSGELEVQANRFAAKILMPLKLLTQEIENGQEDIAILASRFKVSRSAMSIRLGVPYERKTCYGDESNNADFSISQSEYEQILLEQADKT